MQENKEELTQLCAKLLELLLDITVTLIVSAAHAGKTVRIVKRFAKAYGFDVYLMMQTKSVILTLTYSEFGAEFLFSEYAQPSELACA